MLKIPATSLQCALPQKCNQSLKSPLYSPVQRVASSRKLICKNLSLVVSAFAAWTVIAIPTANFIFFSYILSLFPPFCKEWRINALLLVLRSSATRFRWSQCYYTAQDEWALDNIYIGQQCPNMCSGHGWCDHGVCRYEAFVSPS